MGRHLPPWHYRRDRMPSRSSLRAWMRKANKLAREQGGLQACNVCKRPLAQYGQVTVRHPNSFYGGKLTLRVCSLCSNLVIHMLDVLSWFGASDNLPPEKYNGQRGDAPSLEEYEQELREQRENKPSIRPPHWRD